MPPRNRQVDAYIKSAAPFAQPVLSFLRDIIHEACPDVEERIKWGIPSLEYKGPMCGIAAFKHHCVLGFWKHSLLFPDAAAAKEAGIIADQRARITSLKDLPSKRVLIRIIKRAVALNEAGIKVTREQKPKTPVVIPKDLGSAIKANPKAADNFKAFSYSKRKDYVEWITEAKTPETRAKRLATAVEWIAEGKGKNWKYERK